MAVAKKLSAKKAVAKGSAKRGASRKSLAKKRSPVAKRAARSAVATMFGDAAEQRPRAAAKKRAKVAREEGRSASAASAARETTRQIPSSAIAEARVLEQLLLYVVERSFDTAAMIEQLGLGKVLSRSRLKGSPIGAEIVDLVQAAAQKARALASEAVGLGSRIAQSTAVAQKRSTPTLLKYTDAKLRHAIEQSSAAMDTVRRFEEATTFTVCPQTRSGLSIHDFATSKSDLPLEKLKLDPASLDQCIQKLRSAGCRILEVGDFSVTAVAPSSVVASMLDIRLGIGRSQEVETDLQSSVLPSELYVSAGESSLVRGDRLHPAINSFVFSPAPISLQPPPAKSAPKLSFAHLDADGVRRFLNLPKAGEDSTFRGRGVGFALVDSGFYAAHPFFAWNRYQLEPRTTATSGPASDDFDGHGTMMAWNVFAVAPECRILGFKHSDGAPQDAIINARRAGAAVICCSWGIPASQAGELGVLRAEIQGAVEDGAIVVCAVGNRQLAWPAVMRDVIAVGGVHADPVSGHLAASTFTQRGDHGGRRVPDVCGLAGHAPAGVYLPLPCAPGSQRDVHYGKNAPPLGDGISMTDGWVYASGSSSAAAQIAGVVALLVEKATQRGVTLTTRSALDVLQAASNRVEGAEMHQTGATTPWPSVAFRGGLVDVERALALIG